MKDLEHSVKGSCDCNSNPTLKNYDPISEMDMIQFHDDLNKLRYDIDTLNLRIVNLEYNLCSGELENEDLQDMQPGEVKD